MLPNVGSGSDASLTPNAFLFHGTGIYCLASIAQQGVLREGGYWGKPGEPHGPRFSTDFDAAARFIGYSSYWGEGGVVVVDRRVLSSRVSLVNYTDTFYEGGVIDASEREVAAITPTLQLTGALVALVCDPRILDEARNPEWMLLAQEEGGWPFGGGSKAGSRALAALDTLAKHPALNAWIPARGAPLQGNWSLPECSRSRRCRL